MNTLIISFVCVALLAAVTGSPYLVTYNDSEDNTISPGRLPESPLLGRKACTRGPAYWCYNITQAKQCCAVSHCIQRVWEPMKLPADNDSVCEVCKEMVKEARDQLLSNETQDELRQVLEGSCNLIPLKIVAAECRKLSDDFIPELIDVLTSRMDPEVVCAVSGLCNSVRIDEMLGEMKQMEPSKAPAPFDLKTNSCPKCTHFMGKAVTFLKRLSKEQMLTKMLEICGHTGSYSDSCRAVVMEELDTIYNHVQNELNAPEVCGLVGLCEVVSIHPVKIQTPSTSVRAWTPPVNDDDLECDFCKQLITYLKTWFTSDTTKEEFHDLVIGMCKQTGKYRQECLNLAKEYGQEIYDLIVDGLAPEEICGSAGICNSTVQGRVKINVGPIWTLLPVGSTDEIPLTKLHPAERITGKDEKKSHQPGVYPMMELSPSERLTGDDEANAHRVSFDPAVCETCQNIAIEAQKFFKSHANVTEEKLKKYVIFFCDNLLDNKEQVQQCHDIVDKYGHAFVHVMIKYADPDIVCPAIKLCPVPPDMEIQLASIELPVAVETPPVQGVRDILPTCALCTFTITKLVDMIGGNRSKAAIDNAMDRVCYVIPTKYEEKCLTFMKEYGEKVAEMILLEGGAHEICAAIHLCLFSPARTNPATTEHPVKLIGDALLSFDRYMPKTMVKNVMDKIKEVYPTIQSHIQVVVNKFNPTDSSDESVSEKPTCAMCEFVMTQLDSMLENNATEQEIKDTVEHICDYLPKTVRTECRQFVDEYGDLVISYLAQSLEPREICVKLNLCDATYVIIDDDGLVMITDNVELDRCEVCKLVSDYLSAFLEDPKVDISIEEMVEKVCPFIPSNHRNECKEIIQDYGPYLISLLAQATDKGKACETINLCPAA